VSAHSMDLAGGAERLPFGDALFGAEIKDLCVQARPPFALTFGGIYEVDSPLLPEKLQPKSYIILHKSKQGERMGHWISIVRPSRMRIYECFDSEGTTLNFLKTLPFRGMLIVNSSPLQPPGELYFKAWLHL